MDAKDLIDQKISEGNFRIAKYMGGEYDPKFANSLYKEPIAAWIFPKDMTPTSEYSRIFYPDELKYHSSWEWLMNVVEKIESLGWNINILRSETAIYEDKFKNRNDGICIVKREDNKIRSTWLAIVDLLEHIKLK